MSEKIDPRNKKELTTYWLLVFLWIAVNLFCWQWWFKVEHIGNKTLFILVSVAILYESCVLPSFYLFFLGKVRKPVSKNAEKGLKVAMISLCVPSKESIDIITRQLLAMKRVSYPHDSWILDEEKNEEVKEIAHKLGVKYFSRKGKPRYNQEKPPFQKKTKAGNVNSWLNWIKEEGYHYDFFTQLDIDHKPKKDYLDKVLGFFKEDNIAWVQAPSVYSNFQESWCARGASEQELVLQGPLQMGFFGFTETPFIIGSHTTYRTSAIIKIGGFQPTRAEDHLDTVVLASQGYKGVFLPEVIAEGKGPENFNTYLNQQFAWAYSMMQVLLYYMPRLIRKYNPKQAIQFLFAQTWYTFWSTSMVILFSLPNISLLINKPIAYMNFFEALVHFIPIPLTSLAFWWWSRRWFQPKNVNLSWRGIVLHIARWPIVFWALINVLLEVKKPYMITSKGKEIGEKRIINISNLLPYIFLLIFNIVSSFFYLFKWKESSSQGYLIFNLQNSLIILFLIFVVVLQNIKEMKKDMVALKRALKLHVKPLTIFGSILLISLITASLSAPKVTQAISWGNSQNTIAFVGGQGYIGAYDPNNQLDPLDILHYFVDWKKIGEVNQCIIDARGKGKIPMITLEPWPRGKENVLQEIEKGSYDKLISDLARIFINNKQQQILIRWGHEMELTGVYPWSTPEPFDYINAYRRVVDIIKKEGATNVIWLWSPAGEYKALTYYPGDSYVDAIGVTILSYPSWNESITGKVDPTFREFFNKRAWIQNYFQKPIIVAEYGISSNDPERKEEWIKESREVLIENLPKIWALVYFNARNLSAIDGSYIPDWSIDNQIWKGVWR